MQPLLFDTSVYISVLRSGETSALRRMAAGAAVWLSSVVLEELYAGLSERDRQPVERLERDFHGARRVLVPNLSDWTQAGKVLARMGSKHGYEHIGKGRLTNDALIATSAGRTGITVVTVNARDFGRLAEFRPFSWRTA